jgi:hypothetical protein
MQSVVFPVALDKLELDDKVGPAAAYVAPETWIVVWYAVFSHTKQ